MCAEKFSFLPGVLNLKSENWFYPLKFLPHTLLKSLRRPYKSVAYLRVCWFKEKHS